VVQGHGNVFEALKTIAAFFLRADLLSICDCINTFGLNDVLFSVARMAEAFGSPEGMAPMSRTVR
jgi:hypothetical protein